MFIRIIVLSALSLAFAGCKVEISDTKNGRVESESGAYTCDSGDTCVIDVVDTFFDETFQAKPDQGFIFTAWRTKPHSICGGSSKPCRLATRIFSGTPLMNILESDGVYYLEPVFGKRNSWRDRAATFYGGVGAAACAMRGELYAMGLGWGSGAIGKVEVYNPVANSWRALAPMQTPRNWVTASVVKNKCYVIGGGNASMAPAMATVEAYDPGTNSWQTRTSLPEGRQSAGSAVVKGKIYVIGGGDAVRWDDATLASVAIYDPTTDTWSEGADMPTPRKGVGVAAVDGLVYAVGGMNYDMGIYSSGIVERYDPAIDQWTTLPSMPVKRSHLVATALNGKLYAAGGLIDQGSNTASTVYSYDPQSNQWTQRADMSTARYAPATALLDGQMYVVGGRPFREFASTRVTEEYTP